MSNDKELTKRNSNAAASETPAMVPPVDVTEDESGITLIADLPGAERESLSVRIDGDTLTLEAPITLGEPGEMEALYAEVRAARWRRSFTLSRELDSEKIEASLKDGLLTLRLPKQERARPRRIEVRSA